MTNYKVWFYDEENDKMHSIKVEATGIMPAIEEAGRKMWAKYFNKTCGWEIVKAEKC